MTGSNKGIGLATVRALCKQYDGDVYLAARDVARGTAAVEGLRAEGLAPRFHQLDITDAGSVRAARDFFKAEYGGVDVLVNNAGIAFKSNYSDPSGVGLVYSLTHSVIVYTVLSCIPGASPRRLGV